MQHIRKVVGDQCQQVERVRDGGVDQGGPMGKRTVQVGLELRGSGGVQLPRCVDLPAMAPGGVPSA